MTTNPAEDNPHFEIDPDDKTIFDGVIFELEQNISSTEQSTLKEQLLNHGAKCYDDEKDDIIEPIDHPTHFITDRAKPVDATYSVTPLWVTAAIRNGFTHDPKYYTPDPSKHFSGIVVTTSGIPKRDQEAIFGATIALGGQYRENLTSDVTHLVCLAPEGDMYDEAMGPLFGKVKVLLPHWFDECFRLRRLVPEDAYLFPDPLFTRQQATSNQTSESNISTAVSSPNKQIDNTTKIQHAIIDQQDTGLSRSNSTTSTTSTEIDTIATPKSKDKENSTAPDGKASADNGPMVYTLPKLDVLKTLVPKDRFFDGKLIYIHSDVGLPPDIRTCLLQHLETAGATVTNNYDDIKDHGSAIAIFKYRNSDLFFQACNRPDIVVASFTWITNTLMRGRVESPLRSICDYPIPYGGIVGMQKLTATISGYEGDARNILFHICAMVGLPCSFNLDHNTTHLICSKRGTDKYNVGKRRNCDIVNHLWLEECFQQWELKSVADERYTYFPSNNILQTLVGKTPLTIDNLKPWFNKETCPAVSPYTPIHLLYRSSTAEHSPSSSFTGSARRPRQAALDANSQLRDVFIPDMNNYQKEQRSSHNSPTAPTTTAVSTDSTGKQRRRRSVPSPSPSSPSSTASKRVKLNNMKSKSASSKQTTSAPSSPPQSPLSKSSSNTAPHPSSKTPSTQSTATESKDEHELIEDEEMEYAISPANSKQKPSSPSSFVFADNPSKIAITSCELTKDEEKGIRKLGSALVEDIRKADVLVVPDRILRTPKFLCAVNLGITIVDYQWLKDSVADQAWCDTSEYQVEDSTMEASHSFKLADSLVNAQRANQLVAAKKGKGGGHGNWLLGYEVCVLPSAGSAQALKDVVETAGGKIVPVPKRRSRGSSSQGTTNTQDNADINNQLLALADKKDKKQKGWRDLLELGIKVYDKEMIIVGALRQQLALDEFSLAQLV